MIPLIGFIVATYAIARLIQVPIEIWHSPMKWWAMVVSLIAILVIGALSVMLIFESVSSTVPNLPR